MTDSSRTHIHLILDRSGSMEQIRDDTIGGVNRFIEDQQQEAGHCTFTFVQFDTHDPYEVVHDRLPIDQVPKLTRDTFVPRAMTPLLDAIGRGINELGAQLSALPEQERPGKVIFVIQTDGLENSSREFTKKQINRMIHEQQERYHWRFVFLGANQDAIETAGGLGIARTNALTFGTSGSGVRSAQSALSRSISSTRRGRPDDAFTDAERRDAAEE